MFLGAVAMYSNIELMLFVLFQARSRQAPNAAEASACAWMATFAFFLFVRIHTSVDDFET